MKKKTTSVMCEHGKNHIMDKCLLCAEQDGRPRVFTPVTALIDKLRYWLMAIDFRAIFALKRVVPVVLLVVSISLVSWCQVSYNNALGDISASDAVALSGDASHQLGEYQNALDKMQVAIRRSAVDGDESAKQDLCWKYCSREEYTILMMVRKKLLSDGFVIQGSQSRENNTGIVTASWGTFAKQVMENSK